MSPCSLFRTKQLSCVCLVSWLLDGSEYNAVNTCYLGIMLDQHEHTVAAKALAFTRHVNMSKWHKLLPGMSTSNVGCKYNCNTRWIYILFIQYADNRFFDSRYFAKTKTKTRYQKYLLGAMLVQGWLCNCISYTNSTGFKSGLVLLFLFTKIDILERNSICNEKKCMAQFTQEQDHLCVPPISQYFYEYFVKQALKKCGNIWDHWYGPLWSKSCEYIERTPRHACAHLVIGSQSFFIFIHKWTNR